MSHTGCSHAKVRIADPLGDPDTSYQVDARIAPLIVKMSDCGPWFACEDEFECGEAEFVFVWRTNAISFIGDLADFGRSDEFSVSYQRDEIGVRFPLKWVDGLVERYRRFWERRVEAARASTSSRARRRRERHPTVAINGIKIDVDLAPLIGLLWDAGIKTNMCCQECEHGICRIGFPSPAEALRFFSPASTLASECHWTLDGDHEPGDDFEANPIGCVSVEFPREDLGTLIRRWKPTAHEMN
jgi:hypothetical protein